MSILIVCSNHLEYEGESKVLQYFAHVRNNSAVLDVFAEVVNVTNNTGV